jgi:hypothetical protein
MKINVHSPSEPIAPSKSRLELVLFDPDLPPGALDFDHVLFLDFDGVFHPEGTPPEYEFEFVGAFHKTLREVDPEGLIPIVITSMWRFDETVAQLRAHFPEDLGRQIVGVTPDLTPPKPIHAINAWGDGTLAPIRGQREREIRQWMAEHVPAGQWLAIDDRDNLFEAGCEQLFLVPGVYEENGGGLVPQQCTLLLDRLGDFLMERNPQKAMAPP